MLVVSKDKEKSEARWHVHQKVRDVIVRRREERFLGTNRGEEAVSLRKLTHSSRKTIRDAENAQERMWKKERRIARFGHYGGGETR